MISIIVLVILLLSCLLLFFIYKTLNYLPVREIKKRMNRDDSFAIRIYPSIAYKTEIEGLIIIKLIILIAISLVIIARSVPVWFGIIALISYLVVSYFLIGKKPNKFILKVGLIFLRLYAKFLTKFKKYLPLKLLAFFENKPKHSGLYDLDDLTELVKEQLAQEDNRIIEEDLVQISNLLSLSKEPVSKLMIKISNFPIIKSDDLVTPVVIDEIHRIKGSYIPVYDNDNQVLGFINKNRLGLESEGSIKNYIDHVSEKLNQNDSLYDAVIRLINDNSYALPVYNDLELIGVIDLGLILSFILSLRQA